MLLFQAAHVYFVSTLFANLRARSVWRMGPRLPISRDARTSALHF